MPGSRSTRYVLAVDLGTSGVKVALVRDGRSPLEFEPSSSVLPDGGASSARTTGGGPVAATRRLLAPAPSRRSRVCC